MVFMGTHVVSGNAKAVIVHVGKETELGRIAGHVMLRPAGDRFRARRQALRLLTP